MCWRYGTQVFEGTFTLDRVIARGSELFGLGTLAGTVTKGTSTQEISRAVQMPLDLASGAVCTVLDLTLGPLDLNLLGLRVELSQIDLLITAIPGALLGDLLCAVSGLLSGGGAANAIAKLLNEIPASSGNSRYTLIDHGTEGTLKGRLLIVPGACSLQHS